MTYLPKNYRKFRSEPPASGRNKQSALKAGLLALQAVRKIQKKMNVETKYYDYNISGINTDYNGTQYPVNQVSQGDTDQSRDGDSMKVLNANWNFIVTRNGADAYVRIMIIWDNSAKYSAVSDVLAGTGSSIAPISNRTYDNRFWFKTLFDKVVHVDTYKPEQHVHVNVPIHKHTQFSGGTTTITTGVLRVIVVSDQVTTNLPITDFTCRTFFTDN